MLFMLLCWCESMFSVLSFSVIFCLNISVPCIRHKNKTLSFDAHQCTHYTTKPNEKKTNKYKNERIEIPHWISVAIGCMCNVQFHRILLHFQILLIECGTLQMLEIHARTHIWKEKIVKKEKRRFRIDYCFNFFTLFYFYVISRHKYIYFFELFLHHNPQRIKTQGVLKGNKKKYN